MNAIDTSFWAVLLASVLGSMHCVGMCGGLAAFCSGSSGKPLQSSGAYHLGRLLSYTALGALAGWVGKTLDLAGALLGVQHTATLLSAVILLLAGFAALRNKSALVSIGGSPSNSSWSDWLISRIPKLTPLRRSMYIGLFSGALPCGWLWAFVILAAGSASVPGGASIMLAFWLGSVPALLAVNGAAHLFSTSLRQYSPKLSALLLLIAGSLTLYQHMSHLSGFNEKIANSTHTESAPACH